MSDMKGSKIFQKGGVHYNTKEKSYSYLRLISVFDITDEEAKKIAKLAKSGNKSARKLFKKTR